MRCAGAGSNSSSGSGASSGSSSGSGCSNDSFSSGSGISGSDSDSDSMQLTLKTTTGQVFALALHGRGETTVGGVIAAAKTQHRASVKSVIYNGKVLDQVGQTLDSAGVDDGATCIVILFSECSYSSDSSSGSGISCSSGLSGSDSDTESNSDEDQNPFAAATMEEILQALSAYDDSGARPARWQAAAAIALRMADPQTSAEQLQPVMSEAICIAMLELLLPPAAPVAAGSGEPKESLTLNGVSDVPFEFVGLCPRGVQLETTAAVPLVQTAELFWWTQSEDSDAQVCPTESDPTELSEKVVVVRREAVQAGIQAEHFEVAMDCLDSWAAEVGAAAVVVINTDRLDPSGQSWTARFQVGELELPCVLIGQTDGERLLRPGATVALVRPSKKSKAKATKATVSAARVATAAASVLTKLAGLGTSTDEAAKAGLVQIMEASADVKLVMARIYWLTKEGELHRHPAIVGMSGSGEMALGMEDDGSLSEVGRTLKAVNAALECALRNSDLVSACLACRLPQLSESSKPMQGREAALTVAGTIGAGGATVEQLKASAEAIVACDWVRPLVDIFESSNDEHGEMLLAAEAIIMLCGQVQASTTTDFVRRLVAAGFGKGQLVDAIAKIPVGPHQMSSLRSTPAEKAKFKLEELLKDTELMTALTAAERAEANWRTETEEGATPLTVEATEELVRTRLARNLRSWPEDTMEGHDKLVDCEPAPEEPAMHEPAPEKASRLFQDCALCDRQQTGAKHLAHHVLTVRRHRVATAGMVDGGAVPCDCSLFVAKFHGTNRPRIETAVVSKPWCCSNCRVELSEERIATEEAIQAKVEAEDVALSGGDVSTHALRLHGFGLSIEFLISITVAFDCWTWPTSQVQRDIIRPLCRDGHLRFAELPWVKLHVGPADIFISHTWAAYWGTLVTAAVDGAAHGRFVWIDNIAVRQFPGNIADLDFDGVIKHSKALLLVTQALPGVAGLETKPTFDLQNKRVLKEGQIIPAAERRLFPPCRVWCLAEVNASLRHRKPLVVKAGSAARKSDSIGAMQFVPDRAMLSNLQHLIDVEAADASVSSDKEMIMTVLRAEPDGVEVMNTRIVGAMRAAFELTQLGQKAAAAVAGASCGEPEQLGLLGENEKAEAFRGAAAAGLAGVVQALLLSGARTDAADTDGRTVFFLAVTNGHADVVTILLEAGGAEVSTCGEFSRTALHVAAERGHVDMVALLLEHDARMYLETRDDMGYTALILAAGEGHLEVVRALLQCGADATAKDDSGYTGLHELAVAQHQSVKAASNGPELVKLFVNAGADVNALSGRKNAKKTALSLFLDFNRRERNGSFALALRAGGAVSTSELARAASAARDPISVPSPRLESPEPSPGDSVTAAPVLDSFTVSDGGGGGVEITAHSGEMIEGVPAHYSASANKKQYTRNHTNGRGFVDYCDGNSCYVFWAHDNDLDYPADQYPGKPGEDARRELYKDVVLPNGLKDWVNERRWNGFCEISSGDKVFMSGYDDGDIHCGTVTGDFEAYRVLKTDPKSHRFKLQACAKQSRDEQKWIAWYAHHKIDNSVVEVVVPIDWKEKIKNATKAQRKFCELNATLQLRAKGFPEPEPEPEPEP